ncbi:MAG TPA: DsbA family protein [Acidimicrobiales bacterium]|nr:DsbA family protein [Acidimicrobiales bacterium]
MRWLGFSLNQTKVVEGEADVWDDPEQASTRMAVEVGIAVRDHWPDAFAAVHRGLFAARHDEGLDLREHDVVADVLTAHGLDADEVFNEVLGCGPRDSFRAEHEAAVKDHHVFGVPTVIADGRAVFIRLVDRPGADPAKARETVDRCVDLVTGWPNLNEFKHTTIPH